MKSKTLISLLAVTLLAASNLMAAPKSSAPYQKTLNDAERIAAMNPGWSVQRTSGRSMGQFFGDNSFVIVQDSKLSEIHVGMMVVYRSAQGELICHQVIAKNGDTLRTKGVTNSVEDPAPVTENMLVGAVFAVFHSSGTPKGPIYTASGAPVPTALCKSF
jgi:signal peptidase I